MNNSKEKDVITANLDKEDLSYCKEEDINIKTEEYNILDDPMHIKEEIGDENEVDVKEENYIFDTNKTTLQSSSKATKVGSKPIYECTFCNKRFKLDRTLQEHISIVHNSKKPHKCSICGQEFMRYKILLRHIKFHSERTLYSCYVCDKKLKFKHTLKDHLLNFHTGKISETCTGENLECLDMAENCVKWVCFACQGTFTSLADLKDHLGVHIDMKSFKCTICSQEFKLQSEIDSHMMSHPDGAVNVPSLTCEVCQLKFVTTSDLKKHYLTHESYKPYSCDECGKSFKAKRQLTIHKVVHTGERSHVCHICDKKFFYLKSLKKHMISHEEERPLVCPVCGKTFKRKYPLQIHMLAHKEKGDKFECELCHKILSSSVVLKQHIARHVRSKDAELKKYVCDICGKAHYDKWMLEKHKIAHSVERPHHCSICDKSYKTIIDLRRHKGTHYPDNTVFCTVCQRSFKYKRYLKLHKCCPKKGNRDNESVNSPPIEKPFPCYKCNKRFLLKRYLIQHMKAHSTNREFSCNLCLKRFKYKVSLNTHNCKLQDNASTENDIQEIVNDHLDEIEDI